MPSRPLSAIALTVGCMLILAATACNSSPKPENKNASSPAAQPETPKPAVRLDQQIERVEAMDKSPAGDRKILPGQRLWVVHFRPTPLEKDLEKKVRLVDDAGNKHQPLDMLLTMRTNPTDKEEWVTLSSELTGLVFALPRNRKPQSLQVEDAAPVALPAP